MCVGVCGYILTDDQVNPRKTQKNLHPTELERYSTKLLGKAETIVSSAGRIWGVFSQSDILAIHANLVRTRHED